MGEQVEIVYYMDVLNASSDIQIAPTNRQIMKEYAGSVWMVFNKKSVIQLNVETPLPLSLQDIHLVDETTYKYLGFEMKKGVVDRKEMMKVLEQRIQEKLEEPTRRVDEFELKNWIHFVNQNIMSVVRFLSGKDKFTLGWLDRNDLIRQHLTQQGMLMKHSMATSRRYMKPNDMGMGLKSCVGVYLVELVRILLQYNGEPSSDRSGSGGWRSSPRDRAKVSGCEKSRRC